MPVGEQTYLKQNTVEWNDNPQPAIPVDKYSLPMHTITVEEHLIKVDQRKTEPFHSVGNHQLHADSFGNQLQTQ